MVTNASEVSPCNIYPMLQPKYPTKKKKKRLVRSGETWNNPEPFHRHKSTSISPEQDTSYSWTHPPDVCRHGDDRSVQPRPTSGS